MRFMLRDDTDTSIIVLGLVLFYTEKPRDVRTIITLLLFMVTIILLCV